MTLEIQKTGDGSDTVYSAMVHQHYHSTYGAITESAWIFIDHGLRYRSSGTHGLHDMVSSDRHLLQAQTDEHQGDSLQSRKPQQKNSGVENTSGPAPGPIRILEIGFGTGLNALLTINESMRSVIRVAYDALEAYPLPDEIWQQLNFTEVIGKSQASGLNDPGKLFSDLHRLGWDQVTQITPDFSIRKIHARLETFVPDQDVYDLIYFDAFDPVAQPGLWTVGIFEKLYRSMAAGGVLVTYSSKGSVKRALKSAGFIVERLTGPPGKRHMVRATKTPA